MKTKVRIERQVASLEGKQQVAKIEGFGDLVVLVNPAFEALLYDSFNRLRQEITQYKREQHVILMTVGANNDRATGVTFPLGQFFGRFRERKQSWRQWLTILRSVTNHRPYFTHGLELRDQQEPVEDVDCGTPGVSCQPWDPENLVASQSSENWSSFVPELTRWQLTEEQELPENCAFMVIQARQDIVKGHNGIFRPIFIEFLRDFVIAQDLHVADIQSESQQVETPEESSEPD